MAFGSWLLVFLAKSQLIKTKELTFKIKYLLMKTITKEIQKSIAKKNTPKIPNNLIYEIIDGKPIYYANYKQVLNNNKQIQDIMGCSGLQAEIIDLIIKFFHKIEFQGNKKYKILYSELGLHLEAKNNLAADITIYNKSDISQKDITDQYMKIPPRIIFEIDTKADLNNDFDATLEYLEVKSKKLINFGVEKLFWILTKSKKIIVITENKKWYFADWNEELPIIDDLKFSLQKLINDKT